MKKSIKITLGISFGIIFILALFSLGGYLDYRNKNSGSGSFKEFIYDIGSRNIDNITSQEVVDFVEEETGENIVNLKGLANSRVKIRNSTGYEVIGLSHDGQITALGNLTVNSTTPFGGGYGYFTYLGTVTHRIINGLFVDLDVSQNINSTNFTTQLVDVTGDINATGDICITGGNCLSSTFANVVEDTTPQLGGYLDTNGQNIGATDDEIENIYVATNSRIYFGDGQEASIYYDGTNFIIG